jgi:hypothetical protein
VDRVDKQILPEHILELYRLSHERKPVPSIWDFGFVTDDVLGITKAKPYYEVLGPSGLKSEVYFRTPEYDIYLRSSIEGYELYFLYDSEIKDAMLLASSQIKKYKIKFEE